MRQIETLNLSLSKSHLGRQIIPSCQMFEAEEAVPLAGATSAGVIVHNLRRREKSSAFFTTFTFDFLFTVRNKHVGWVSLFKLTCDIAEIKFNSEVWLHLQHLEAYCVTECRSDIG